MTISGATEQTTPQRHHLGAAGMVGPAFVAAIAYVDPGNVAANLSAGARYGYLLVWVLVLANAMAVLVQYLSAKLGIVTGRSLPELIAERLPPWGRRAYWLQAELMAIATDLAEVIGGAIALNLLFGLPLPVGGLITGAVSLLILTSHSQRRRRTFERVLVAMLLVITVGFLTGLFLVDVDPAALLGGLEPRFAGTDSVLLAASMLGATVMPHAIHLHSALTRDRFGRASARLRQRALRATRWDVVLGLALAGTVNIGMLVLAAAALSGRADTDTIEGAHAAITAALGSVVGTVFAIGLLASGFASTAVGSASGSEVMKALLRVRVPLLARRVVVMVPALVVLTLGVDPTRALVISQVVLSLCIPFALIPLVRLCGNQALMGENPTRGGTLALAWVSTAAIVALNLALIVLTLGG